MTDRLFRVRIIIALGVLIGMALSLPLWVTRAAYPRLPLFGFVSELAFPLDFMVLLLFAVTLAILVWRPRYKAIAVLWVLVVAGLMLQDQTRLQPWFVEYVLLFLAMILPEEKSVALAAGRLIIAAMYFWSGVHKLNHIFPEVLFRWLISPLRPGLAGPLQPFGILVPYLEMTMGLSLLFAKVRRYGVVAIVAMHGFLLAMLGPWALNWNRVVWPWNLAMMALVPILFWRSRASAQEILIPAGSWARRALFVFVVVLPPLSLIGLWDTYPAFALYPGNPVSGSVVISPALLMRLDPAARSVAVDTGGGYRIRFGDWSEAAIHVPAYPEPRALRSVARSLCPMRGNEEFAFVLEKPGEWFYRPGWHISEDSRELCGSSLRETH